MATASLSGKPRVTFVYVNKIESDKIIITDNEMNRMRINLLENNQIALLVFETDYSYCLRITGTAEYYHHGEYFEFVRNSPDNKKQNPKGAIVIAVNEVIEFK